MMIEMYVLGDFKVIDGVSVDVAYVDKDDEEAINSLLSVGWVLSVSDLIKRG